MEQRVRFSPAISPSRPQDRDRREEAGARLGSGCPPGPWTPGAGGGVLAQEGAAGVGSRPPGPTAAGSAFGPTKNGPSRQGRPGPRLTAAFRAVGGGLNPLGGRGSSLGAGARLVKGVGRDAGLRPLGDVRDLHKGGPERHDLVLEVAHVARELGQPRGSVGLLPRAAGATASL